LAEATIRFSAVLKKYGNKKIGPVTFEVRKGEVMGFLGPNGSGKTTCIRMLLGLIKPSYGSVTIKGLDPLRNHSQALQGVGYSPELPNIQTFLTPEELLRLVSAELGVESNAVNDEVARILELVGLSEYRRVKVGKLSKGMVQRLSLAQAMVGSPKVLVLDEPMIGIDPAGTAHFRDVFRHFALQGGTILLSSHMMPEVQSLCDSVTMIHAGKILFSGNIQDVLKNLLPTTQIIVEAEGLTDECVSKIAGIDGVLSANKDNGRLEVTVSSKVEVRPTIAETVVGSGGRLLTIKQQENLLEKVYIESLGRDGNEV